LYFVLIRSQFNQYFQFYIMLVIKMLVMSLNHILIAIWVSPKGAYYQKK